MLFIPIFNDDSRFASGNSSCYNTDTIRLFPEGVHMASQLDSNTGRQIPTHASASEDDQRRFLLMAEEYDRMAP
jgi:hypothetical protein